MIRATPVIDLCFASLNDPELLDVCVDIICEVILKSCETPRNDALIEILISKLLPLSETLQISLDDPDMVRGLCRIFVEAGEGYMDLILSNLSFFQSILSSILICATYDDLEICKITFNVWYLLAEEITNNKYDLNFRQQFVPIYQQLISVIIKHLEYPADLSEWKSQDRDDFKDFRYVMGDVLKDCVRVLGEEALNTPCSLLKSFFSENNGEHVQLDLTVPWQKIEAPLFSLRAMCSQLSLQEHKYIPELMSLLPRLPNHPKIRYAAILVIGRYAEWTNMHPEYLSFQLDYVSKCFELPECANACSSAFRDLCKYCPNV